MKLTNYAKEIFDIAKENDKDIGVGRDMFLANLEQKEATYHGADGLDYAALGTAWAELPAEEKAAQKQLYNDVTAVTAAGGRYSDLCDARSTGDHEKFEAIVAEAVAALEQPAEVE